MACEAATADRRRLQPHPASVGAARRFVRHVLVSAGRDDLVEDAELLVSEVVTNAVVHAGTAVELTASVSGNSLYVEVRDGSSHLPGLRNYTAMAGTGRGLRLLEQLVDRWGVRPEDDGKTLWFELSSARAGGAEPRPMDFVASLPIAPGTALDDQETVTVTLGNVPLLLHAAWQMHAQSLLREYLLARLDVGNAIEEIETHAAAGDAMSLLGEQIPVPDLGEDPEDLMAGATEPLVSRGLLVVRIPRVSVLNFRLLNDTMDAAVMLAESGGLLSQPTQPELVLLRRWLCQQVQGQAYGTAPTPWNITTDSLQAPARAPVDWDGQDVAMSSRALIAADDTNRIIALSSSARDMLGYDDANELLHHRLLEVIPARFHQAHLAGFTMNLAAGRSPLIGRPVVVPALRRDGVEVLVELVVNSHPLPGGRRLFIAELNPSVACA